jgi:hypothetical protein
MVMRVGVLGLLVTALAGSTVADTVTWEAYALAAPGRLVLGKGVKQYSPAKDIVVQEQSGEDGRRSWEKSLLLDENFALTARVLREPRLDGFGLLVYRRGDNAGFSWEWFDRERDGFFAKLQGSGRLAVQTKKGADYEELQAVEFLDDVVLRYLDDMSKPPGTHTHEIVIRKGSVFRVAP